jgi:hypothetical protein
MPALPALEWSAALDRMTEAIETSLADLDRYRANWSALEAEYAPETPPERLFEWLARRLDQWDAKLNAATELAASVEAQLGERELAHSRWHEHFLRWRELIQQRLAPIATSTGSPGAG